MKLVRADGHQQQQWALTNGHTQKIAGILSEHIEDVVLIRAATQVLKQCTGEVYDDLDQKLSDIRVLYKRRDVEEEIYIPDYIVELLHAIHELYYQPRSVLYPNLKDQINSLRGAVVERLGLELIKHRYRENDECANSRRFVDQRNKVITIQEIDIAALSYQRRQLEGYECKMKAITLENHDRLDLEYLHQAAIEEDYRAQVGVISFDSTKMIERRLKWLNTASCVLAYGVDALDELQYSPFEQ